MRVLVSILSEIMNDSEPENFAAALCLAAIADARPRSLLGSKPVTCVHFESFGGEWFTDITKQLKLDNER